jgi:phage major head subunit gpT-like protein
MASTPMTSQEYGVFTNVVAPLRTVFYDQLEAAIRLGQGVADLYNMQTSSDASERNQGMGGFSDIPEYTGAVDYESPDVLYQKTYEHAEYAKGFAVRRKLVDDEKYGVISNQASQLGLAFGRTVMRSMHSTFNNATSTATPYVGGDGVALCSNSHPLSPEDADTQDNLGTTALSVDAMIAAEQAMMGFTDSKGNPMVVVPDTLIVPLGLKATAETIVGSPLRSGVGNNDANTLSGYKVVVSPYLTDSNNWFLVDSMLAKQYLNFYWRVPIEFTADPKSDFDLEMRMRGYMRYSFGFDHWAWVYGNIVA